MLHWCLLSVKPQVQDVEPLVGQIFTGILWHHYEPPSGFTFDISSKNAPIQVTNTPKCFCFFFRLAWNLTQIVPVQVCYHGVVLSAISYIYIFYGSFLFFVAGTNVQDDARLNDYNLPELVDLFVEYAQNQVCNVTVSQILFVYVIFFQL
jgi:hypothetical protein